MGMVETTVPAKIYNQPWYNELEGKEDVYVADKMSILVGCLGCDN